MDVSGDHRKTAPAVKGRIRENWRINCSMIKKYRSQFNDSYSPDQYRKILESMQQQIGEAIRFRIAESPIFIPSTLLEEMQQTSLSIVRQLSAQPDYARTAEDSIPRNYLFPAEDSHPLFLLFDFAISQDASGKTRPLITEIQGFPSLLAFQYFLSKEFHRFYDLSPELKFLCNGLTETGFRELFGKAILNGHDPPNVALVDVRPSEQSTSCDFYLTQRLCPGIHIVCVTQLRKRGRSLYAVTNGREVLITRIINRIIWDELQKYENEMRFSFHDDLDVEWAGHPNWFFKYSKLSLPFIRHPNVPMTYFLDQLGRIPKELEEYVLKPIFSYSGLGVVLDLTPDLLRQIPDESRKYFILQEKIRFAESLEAPEGTVHCELRLMYVWIEELICVMILPRMSRDRMMGCSYNRSDPWTGHGTCFFPGE